MIWKVFSSGCRSLDKAEWWRAMANKGCWTLWTQYRTWEANETRVRSWWNLPKECVRKWFSQMARLRSFQRSGTGGAPGSSQQSRSGCCLWRPGTKWWENVRYAEECFVKHAMIWSDFFESTQRLWTSWALSHAHVRVKIKCAQTCATRQDREKCACDKVFCLQSPSFCMRYETRTTDVVQTSVSAHTPSLARESLCPVSETPWKNLRMRKNLAKWLPHRSFKESVAFALFTTCDLASSDLAIGCLGVHAIESLDVCVATNIVKMMKRKKVERSKSSNFDSSVLVLLAVLHRMVFASFSRSSEWKNSVVRFLVVPDLREF